MFKHSILPLVSLLSLLAAGTVVIRRINKTTLKITNIYRGTLVVLYTEECEDGWVII